MYRVALLLGLLVGCGRLGFDPDGPEVGQLVVTSPLDNDPSDLLTLREALVLANEDPLPNRITFDPSILPASIQIATPLVVDSAGTKIDAAGASVKVSGGANLTEALFLVTADGVTLEGLELNGLGAAIATTGTTGLVVRDCKLVDMGGDGVRLTGVAQAVVEGGRIERAGGDPIAVRMSSDVRVDGVFMVLTAKIGDVAGVRLEATSTTKIVNNIIDPGPARLVTLLDSSDNEISGNILDRGDVGVILLGASNRNTVIRNVVIEALTDSVLVEGDNNVVVHNTFFLTTPVIDSGTNTLEGNNFQSQAATDFIDPGSYDFRLATGASAIDAATDMGYDLLPADPERFLGAAPDLGAVESF